MISLSVRYYAGCMAAAVILAGCGNRDVRITGDVVVSRRELLASAQRPLDDWRRPVGRLADVHDAAYAMRNQLLDRGYLYADVSFTTDEKRKVTFTIDSGPQLRIGSIDFPGREGVPAEDLRAFFIIRGPLADGQTPFVQNEVESAIRLIERRYRSIGYLDARAGPPKITLTDELVHISVPVHEGVRFRIIAATISGEEEDITRLGAQAHLHYLIGKPYHRLLTAEVGARLRTALGAHGHLHPQVNPQESIDRTTGEVTLDFAVESGPQVILGDIIISGQSRTRTAFIRRRLTGLDSGEPINRTAIDTSVRTLYDTGLFNQVTITPVPSHDGEDVYALAVEVREAPTRSVGVSLGWGSYEQLRGSAEWVDDNVFGEGLRFNAKLRLSLKGWGVDTGLFDRHHLGPGRSLGIDLRHDVREEPSFERTETSFSTTFRHAFAVPIDPSARWSYRGIYALSFNEDRQVEGGIPGEEISSFRLSTITFGLQRDTRLSKPVDPEAGTYLDGSLGWSTKELGSEVPYIDHRIRWTHHRRLTSDLVGVVNVQAQTRLPLDSDSLPIGERLFLGGDSTIRSFSKDAVGPKGVDGKPTGGLSTSLGNIELRWRPWEAQQRVELSLFYDIGALGTEPWSVDGPPGQAVGAGIRYVLPVGPIRFDGAWNPGETFGEDAYAFHLTVGFAF